MNYLDLNIYIICFLGAISGASEWFLPNLIKEFETDETRKIKEIKKQESILQPLMPENLNCSPYKIRL